MAVSSLRLESFIHNPRANPDDVILIVLRENNVVVGYRTMMPDDIYFQGNKIHMAWLSGIWIHPDHRKKGFGTVLHKAAITAWNGLLLGTEYTPINEKAIMATGSYVSFIQKAGVKIYFRSPFNKLLAAKGAGKLSLLIASLADNFINMANTLKNSILKIPAIPSKWSVTERTELTEEAISFIDRYDFYSSFNRRSNEFKWILQYPWLGNDNFSETESLRYHFSVFNKNYKIRILNIYLQGELKAIAFISYRAGVVKIPYIFADISDKEEVSAIILNQLHKIDINTFISYQDDWNESFISHSRQRCFYKKTVRHYLICKELLKLIDPASLLVKDGDGDTIFV